MAEGVHVTGVRKVADGKAGNAMSLVAAADYRVWFRNGTGPCEDWEDKIVPFMGQEEILITKTTKSGEKQVNIRPYIYEMRLEADNIFCRLASASANYTRPDTVTDAFLDFLKVQMPAFSYQIRRLEVYADLGTEEKHRFVPLLELGETVA